MMTVCLQLLYKSNNCLSRVIVFQLNLLFQSRIIQVRQQDNTRSYCCKVFIITKVNLVTAILLKCRKAVNINKNKQAVSLIFTYYFSYLIRRVMLSGQLSSHYTYIAYPSVCFPLVCQQLINDTTINKLQMIVSMPVCDVDER